MMENYTDQLEHLVNERTMQLADSSRTDEKKQSPGVLTNARRAEIVPSPASAHPK